MILQALSHFQTAAQTGLVDFSKTGYFKIAINPLCCVHRPERIKNLNLEKKT